MSGVQHDSMRASRMPMPGVAMSSIAIGAVLALALLLDIFRLGQSGYGNLYYAAAVKSMLGNWHNFFFVAFDPAGFLAVDKPPLGFWLQAASARLLGFSPVSLLLPQALAGVLAVALLYHIVRRVAGRAAGLLAALALTLTPISVVTNRNNTIDSLLVLFMLAAAWAANSAAATGRLRPLLLCAAAIGLGFNVKMLDAYLVLPACAAVYLLNAPASVMWHRRLVRLGLAAVLLAVISFAWAETVDHIPANRRPYIASSPSNSEMRLALGYNGVDRLFAGLGRRAPVRATASQARNGRQPAGQLPGAPARFFGAFEIGVPGPLRLLLPPLSGQVGWLLPVATAGLIELLASWRRRELQAAERRALCLWGVWLVTGAALFSVASSFHAYYTVVIAPAIAALFGIGILRLWARYRQGGVRGWLLPMALAATIAVQAGILLATPGWSDWLAVAVCGGSLLVTAALVLMRSLSDFFGRIHAESMRAGAPMFMFTLAVILLLVGPAVWAAIPLVQRGEGAIPFAGPAPAGSPYVPVPTRPGSSGNRADSLLLLLRYVEASRHTTRFLVATVDATTAAPIIIATGAPVMALGGYTGDDRLLTRGHLASLVARRVVRYFLLPARHKIAGAGAGSSGASAEGAVHQRTLDQWIRAHCRVVGARVPGWSGSGPLQLLRC